MATRNSTYQPRCSRSQGRMTSNSNNRGLAAMPAQERSLGVDGRGLGGHQSHSQRQHREAMARNTSPQGFSPHADVQPSQWDDADWDQDHDEAAGHRARRLLSRPSSGFHRFGDKIGALRRWLASERWVRRLAVVISVVAVIFAGCFGGLWWRLGAGPINLEMATPWLAAAIEENIGHGNTVEVGGTQIQRGGADPHSRAHPRYHRPGSRPRDRGERAESRGQAVGHRAADGTASRREP